MYEFSQIATKILKEYKLLIKKQLPPEERLQKLSELGLDKKLPAREQALYQLMLEVINKSGVEVRNLQSRIRYSGASQFLQHMKDIVANYRVEKDSVVHVTKAAAKAMLQGIQLMSLPEARLTTPVAEQLQDYACQVAKYGLEEQKNIFLNSLQSHLPRHADFFHPLLNRYKEYLAAPLPKNPMCCD